MLLTDEQHKQVVTLIMAHLGGAGHGPMAWDLFGPEAVQAVPAGLNDYQYAKWMLDRSLRQATPDPFIKIVLTVDFPGEIGEVRKLVDDLGSGRRAWSGVGVDELWMPAESPFADREDLRTSLRDIARGGGPVVSTIDGPAGHGKRTMCGYIDACARKHGVYLPVVEHLQRLHDNRFVDFLADLLRSKLRVTVPPAIDPEPERRAVTLAMNLADFAINSPVPVWFVANLVEPDQDAGVVKFLGVLMGQIHENPLLKAKLRMTVLADFAAVELENMPGSDSRYTLAEIAETEIADWLEAVVPGKGEARYRQTARQVVTVVTALQPTPRMRLRLLAQKCVEAHHVLREA